jgi:hypothetical protein
MWISFLRWAKGGRRRLGINVSSEVWQEQLADRFRSLKDVHMGANVL